MLIDDEDQRRQDHNARLFLLLASLTKLLRSLIQPSVKPPLPGVQPLQQPLQEPSYRLSCHTYCPSLLLLANTLFTYKRDGPLDLCTYQSVKNITFSFIEPPIMLWHIFPKSASIVKFRERKFMRVIIFIHKSTLSPNQRVLNYIQRVSATFSISASLRSLFCDGCDLSLMRAPCK